MQIATAKMASSPGDTGARVPGWFQALLVAWIAGMWWMAGADMLARMERSLPGALPQAAMVFGIALSLGARLLVTTLETAFYVSWWRAQSRDLAFGGTWVALLALSLLDLAAIRLGWLARDNGGGWGAWIPWISGIRDLLPPDLPGGTALRNAIGAIGLLALLRMLATAWIQARAARVGFGPALALTSAAWLICRLMTWWSADLVKGMSPMAGM